jgi:hypothetical protein
MCHFTVLSNLDWKQKFPNSVPEGGEMWSKVITGLWPQTKHVVKTEAGFSEFSLTREK